MNCSSQNTSHAQISEFKQNQTPSRLVTALQREHPEWVTEIIDAFGEMTVIVPREHIVEAVSVSEDDAGLDFDFWPTFAAPTAGPKKSRASKSTIICSRPRSITGCDLKVVLNEEDAARTDRDRRLAHGELARARNLRSVRRDLRRPSGLATHPACRTIGRDTRCERIFRCAATNRIA